MGDEGGKYQICLVGSLSNKRCVCVGGGGGALYPLLPHHMLQSDSMVRINTSELQY